MKSPGIFISYSRDDEKQALHLLSILRREGYSVWIDQEAIAGASIWSDEIVQNIKQSDIFIALLSASSTASANVSKEIALAAEHGKIILPIEIGKVTLPGALEYALAGIQRTNVHDEVAILRAIRSQVARLEGAVADSALLADAQSRSQRIRPVIFVGSIMAVLLAGGLFLFLRPAPIPAEAGEAVAVLPFQTLNLDRDSTHNLDIFSDQLLARLASLKALRIVALSTSSAYKNSQLNALAIARELNARFVVAGMVRKSHNVDFVSARIVDTKEGGEVWEESYSGNNRDLFSIRERVSAAITGFLNTETSDEVRIRDAESNLAVHSRSANAYAKLATLLIGTDEARSLDLFQHAIQLDSSNLEYYIEAGIVAERCDADSRQFGVVALDLCQRSMAQHPDSLDLTRSYAVALDLSGERPRAEAVYDSLLHLYPMDKSLNYNAACCYAKQGTADTAVSILQKLFTFAPGKRAEVEADPDFNNIRSFPGYQTLMYGTDH